MDFSSLKKSGSKSRQVRADGYKAGGRVRSGGASHRPPKPEGGAPIDGGASRARLDRPGPKKSPGKVNVNVIVAKGGKPEPDGDEMMTGPAAAPPPMPGLGPPPMRRHGGRISAGADSGVGRIQIGKMARKK